MPRSRRKKKKAQSLALATPPRRKPSRASRSTWKLLDRGSTIAAALLAREVSTLGWRAAMGRKPPTSGRHPEVETREAVAWAVVGGALVELVRLLVRRQAAAYWVRSTGDLPPGMKPLKTPLLPPDATEPAPSRKPARRRRRRR